MKFKAAPPPDSDEDSNEDDELVQKRIKLIRELSELDKPPERFTGGIVISSESKSNLHSASASLSVAEKKGKKEVEELKRELDLKNTFSSETNRRDEDAEMNKYIEEQIKLRRKAAESDCAKNNKNQRDEETELVEFFAVPTSEATDKVDDILLETLSKNYSSTADEKSEAMLSSQMLNGIPEVDLGLDERIRTIEATEEAKLKLAAGSPRNNQSSKSRATINYSSNFQQHRSSRANEDSRSRNTNNTNDAQRIVIEPVVAVGEEPRKIEFRLPTTGDRRLPQKGKASDDYHLQRFKNNSRR